MRIEHIAMYVNDLENAKEFFMKYFSAISIKNVEISTCILTKLTYLT